MRKKGRALFTLALPYLATVFLPILSVLLLSSTILNNYNEQIIADKQRSVQLAFERFLQKKDNVETMATSICTSKDMQNYVYANMRNKGHTPVEYMELMDHLQDFMIDSNVKITYFYDMHENRIVSSQSALSRAEEYFRYSYQVEGVRPEEAVEKMRSLPWGSGYEKSKPVVVNNVRIHVVEYRMSLPVGNPGSVQGHLFIVLDAKKLFSDFIEIQEAGGEFYLYGPGNTLIYSNGKKYEQALDAEEETGLMALSFGEEKIRGMILNDGSWTAKVFMPEIASEGIHAGLQPFFWLLVVAPLLASMVLCVFFTHRNHKEIQGVISLLRGHGEAEEAGPQAVGYQMIREYAGRIVSENNSFKEKISSYEYSQKCAVLDKLVRSAYGSEEEAEEALKDLSLAFSGQCAVLLIRYEGSCYRTWLTEDMTVKDFMKNYLDGLLERPHEIFDTSARETVCLLPVEEKENAEIVLRDIISDLNVNMVYNYDIEVHLVAGDVADSVLKIGDSYAQARAVLNYNETSGSKFSLYSELARLEDIFYYPMEFDEKIYNYTVAGKAEAACGIIRTIYARNFEDNGVLLSARAIDMLRQRLRSRMISIAEKYHISIDAQLQGMAQEQNIRQCFEYACEAVGVMAEAIGIEKKNMQSHSAARIMQYVNENFSQDSLSLKQISQELGLAESYISNLFKSAYGENLSVVIEKKRIDKACDLIKNTPMKIADIAKAVGYTSDASFRRAFKKITGVAPGEYRGG
ncbi:MAG: helix-turn-helix transcriptional regulator [Clostridiales bacterium]|nr:helix-turn-helix transcriptional regulator [Clostridiales bacterium]